MVSKHTELTIKYTVPNLRYRWPKELEPYSDQEIAELYDDFAMSDDHGNNDENFPKWFELLG